MYKASLQKGGGGGCGCIGCLLVLIIFLIAPFLLLGTGLAITVLVAKYWPFIAGYFAVSLFFSIIGGLAARKTFVCLRCGHRFKVN